MAEMSEVKKFVLGLSDKEIMTLLGMAEKKKRSAKTAADASGSGKAWHEKMISGLDKNGEKHLDELKNQLRNPGSSHHVDRKQVRYLDQLKKMRLEVPPFFRDTIDPRINVDKSNIGSTHELLLYCSENGLSDIDVNLGMMKVFGCDHFCNPCDTNLFRMSEFSTEFLRFRDLCEKLGFTNAVEKMSPEYKINSCTMDAPNAYVIDPYGWVYKCISLVGQMERSIGNVLTIFDENAHTKYSPFDSKRCVACKYFPVCKGGCLLNNSGRSNECNVWRFITRDLILRDVVNE